MRKFIAGISHMLSLEIPFDIHFWLARTWRDFWPLFILMFCVLLYLALRWYIITRCDILDMRQSIARLQKSLAEAEERAIIAEKTVAQLKKFSTGDTQATFG